MGALLPRPKAICPQCGTVSVYSEHINRRCAQTFEVEGEEEPVRCEGHFKGAVAPENWTLCADCGGTGVVGDDACGTCHGAGWRYVGNRAAR